MRRFFLSAAIMAIAVGGPIQAQAGDREIAQQIIDRLKVQRDAGSLKDFTLDLKVDQGVVLLRGSVVRADQKESVLAAAKDIDGITKVVDEIEVRDAAQNGFSLKQALAASAAEPNSTTAPAVMAEPVGNPIAMSAPIGFPEPLVLPAGELTRGMLDNDVQTVAATEVDDSISDSQITAAVVSTLGRAQRQGQLKGFGVDVNTRDGKVFLSGRASSQEQRRLITELVRSTPGVYDVSEDIAVVAGVAQPIPTTDLELLPQPIQQPQPLVDTNGQIPMQQRQGTPAQMASARGQGIQGQGIQGQGIQGQGIQGQGIQGQGFQAQPAPYHMGQPVQMQQASMAMGGGYGPMPVPMGPAPGVGSGPRYEQPYLPNYAWPGYAAYPNYAAVSYPQQYSPSAFPYIGPFYPYPQVPLGWRRVSLEWDDGWWYLDFTDK
jgi:osmotically-inducible protein OsmY